MNNNNTQIWGFDIGKASLGEAVWCGGEFKHVESLILDKDFAEIKTSAGRRRQARTRKAHKAREEWLEKCLEDCGIEILKRRKVGIVNGQWKLISKGDARLEKEFPAEGEEVCYNSIALRLIPRFNTADTTKISPGRKPKTNQKKKTEITLRKSFSTSQRRKIF